MAWHGTFDIAMAPMKPCAWLYSMTGASLHSQVDITNAIQLGTFDVFQLAKMMRLC